MLRDRFQLGTRRCIMSAELVAPAHRRGARGLHRVRGHLEGADDAPHATDERHQRHPWRRARRRAARARIRPESTYVLVLGFIAVIFGTMNVVGGFVVTDRMLEMFKPRQEPPVDDAPTESMSRRRRCGMSIHDPQFINMLYLVAAALFIVGLRRLGSPRPPAQATPSPASAWPSAWARRCCNRRSISPAPASS